MDNKLKIASHNKRFRNGEVSYELEMNHFGDLVGYDFQIFFFRFTNYVVLMKTRRVSSAYFSCITNSSKLSTVINII